MKHLLAVGVVFCAAASDSWAQGTEIYTRWGPSGSTVNVPAGTAVFDYEANITGVAVPYRVQLEVYHNSVLEFEHSAIVPVPGTSYLYACPIDMSSWGLRTGDTVTFVLKVIDMATGATLSTHTLNGAVCGT